MTFIAPLTSLRFFAAAAVAWFHLQGAFGYNVNHINFSPAITFFFVLSGFILTHAHPSFPDRGSILEYYVSRIARLWPLHLVTAGYFLWFIFIPSWGVVLANLLLVQSWSMELMTAMSMNGVSWSISVEVFFYLLLPAVIITRSYWPVWLLGSAGIVVFGMFMADRAGEVSETLDGSAWLSFLHVGPPARFLEFMAGVLMAFVFQSMRSPKLSFGAWTFLEVLSLAGVVVACQVDPWLILSNAYLSAGPGVWFTYSGTLPVMCFVVLCFAYNAGAISRALSCRPLVFLGEMSFSVYMVHQLVLVTWIYYGGVPNAWDPVALALITAQIICLSALGFLLVERPSKAVILTAYARFAGRCSISIGNPHHLLAGPHTVPPRGLEQRRRDSRTGQGRQEERQAPPRSA